MRRIIPAEKWFDPAKVNGNSAGQAPTRQSRNAKIIGI